jgi:isoamylase
MSPTILPGKPYPQGATWDGADVNFALYSEHAESVDLCLFSSREARDAEVIPLREHTSFVWHCYLPAFFVRLANTIAGARTGDISR